MDNRSDGWKPDEDGVPPKFIENDFDWIFKQIVEDARKIIDYRVVEFQFWGGQHCVKISQFLN